MIPAQNTNKQYHHQQQKLDPILFIFQIHDGLQQGKHPSQGEGASPHGVSKGAELQGQRSRMMRKKKERCLAESFSKVNNIPFWPGEGQAQVPPENRAEGSASSGQDST